MKRSKAKKLVVLIEQFIKQNELKLITTEDDAQISKIVNKLDFYSEDKTRFHPGIYLSLPLVDEGWFRENLVEYLSNIGKIALLQTYEVNGLEGKVHEVKRYTDDNYTCTCGLFKYRKQICHHIKCVHLSGKDRNSSDVALKEMCQYHFITDSNYTQEENKIFLRKLILGGFSIADICKLPNVHIEKKVNSSEILDKVIILEDERKLMNIKYYEVQDEN